MQAKKLNDKMLQYILAKCGCEMLMGNEADALKDHILALEAELEELQRIQKYAQSVVDDVIREHVGSTIKMREPDGSPCWGGRSCLLHLIDLCAAFREANPKETCHE